MNKKLTATKCPYCNKEAKWVENKEIYGRNYGKSYMCWLCKDCDAYVGCHNNTKEPKGTLANRELRELRIQCHELFDKLWKNGKITRPEAYEYLYENTGIRHIGESNKEQCHKILNFLNNYK